MTGKLVVSVVGGVFLLFSLLKKRLLTFTTLELVVRVQSFMLGFAGTDVVLQSDGGRLDPHIIQN